MAKIKYTRDVDTRTVEFETGIKFTFSNYMSNFYDQYVNGGHDDWEDLFVGGMNIHMVNAKLDYNDRINVVDFLRGRADDLAQ